MNDMIIEQRLNRLALDADKLGYLVMYWTPDELADLTDKQRKDLTALISDFTNDKINDMRPFPCT